MGRADEGLPQWRAKDAGRHPLVLPLLVLAAGSFSVVPPLLAPGGDPWRTFDVALLVCIVAATVLAVVSATRLRVRICDEGLEVRQFRTRLHPWSQLEDVGLTRRAGAQVIAVAMRDGSRMILPTPTAGRRRSSELALAAAVEAIEEHLSPGRTQTLANESTPLDDLLHE